MFGGGKAVRAGGEGGARVRGVAVRGAAAAVIDFVGRLWVSGLNWIAFTTVLFLKGDDIYGVYNKLGSFSHPIM